MARYSYSAFEPAYVECQGCGRQLIELTESQRKHMIENPYAYIVFCGPCKRDGLHLDSDFI